MRNLKQLARDAAHSWLKVTKRIKSARDFKNGSHLYAESSSFHYEPLPLTKPQYYLPDAEHASFLKNFIENPNIHAYSGVVVAADNVYVSVPAMFHKCEKTVFLEGLLDTEITLAYPKKLWSVETIQLKKSTKTSAAVLLALPLFTNYYHWLIEILPRLMLVDECKDLSSVPLLVPAEAPQYVFETLQLAGINHRVQFVTSGIYNFSTLYIPSALSPPSHPSSFSVNWVRDRLLRETDHQHPGDKRRVYVSRRDAPIRFTTNESELLVLLKKYNFNCVVLSEMTVAEQIETFSNADFIISNHGAGLTNLAFCRVGTKVIELFVQGWYTNAFYHIALIRKLNYGFMVCPRVGNGQYVAPEKLEVIIKAALQG
jgi:hypothetical protein